MLGGGGTSFDQTVKAGPYDGLTVRQQAQAKGYKVVDTADELAAANGKKPLLGLFAPVNMDLEWTGPDPPPTGTAPTPVSPTRPARPPSRTSSR